MTPNRDEFRAAYDAVIDEIHRSREGSKLNNKFYTDIGNSVFEACYRALEHSEAGTSTQRLHVVSAPMGAGKTTFSVAFITAMVRMSANDKHLPHGCVFLVEQISKADEMYCELSALLPGKVAVWTSEHDYACTNPSQKISAQFHVDDLKRYPVVIVTHAFFRGKRSGKARFALHDGVHKARALTVIDEQPDDVQIFETTYAGATAVEEAILGDERFAETVGPKVRALIEFMHDRSRGGGSLERPKDAPEAWSDTSALHWFLTEASETCVKTLQSSVPGIVAVFGFAKSMAGGYAFITRDGGLTRFIGYECKHLLGTGTVLLDATADVDGLTQLCPWRNHVEVPQAHYDNLSVVHVESCAKGNLSKHLKTLKNREAYAQWMVSVIKYNMLPGQKGLVVCKKSLFDNQNVPTWSHGDKRFATPEIYARDYGWEIEGRLLSATHWGGYGIGSNVWKDADVVFLFDEHFQPRRVSIARAQGLKGAKVSEGPIATMRATIKGKSSEVETIEQGHLLRFVKQMALRGRGRSFDENGYCGQQKVVFTGSYERLITNAHALFPGAPISINRSDTTSPKTAVQLFFDVLSDPSLPNVLSTTDLSQRLGVEWRTVSSGILKRSKVKAAIEGLGWEYVSAKGRKGGCFRRTRQASTTTTTTSPELALAA